MADYFPLLSRAVSALPESTPVTRRAVYDRARNALLGQLRTIQPPMEESAISAESDSLDDAIARIERELDPAKSDVVAEEAPVEALNVEPSPPSALTPEPLAREQSAEPEITTPEIVKREVAKLPAPPLQEARLPQAERAPPPMRTPLRPLPPMPPVQRDIPQNEFSTLNAPDPVAEPAPGSARAPNRFGAIEDGDGGGAPAVAIRAPGGRFDASTGTREGGRPAAPAAPETSEGLNRRVIWISFALLICVALGVLGWTLRVPPEDFARPRSAQTQAPDREASKTGQRASGEQEGAGSSQDAASAKSPLAQAPAGSQPPASNRAEAQRPTQSPDAPGPLVSQRAALLVQASVNDQQNITTHIGTTLWRLVPSQRPVAAGQPAIRGDVDLPEIALRLTLTIEKNTDTTLRASHTMTIRFTPGPDVKFPAVVELGAPQMRNESAPAVDPLAGVQAKITENIFIVALTGEPAFAARNIETMKTRGWFDFPLRIADGRIAKITMEKGAVGDKMFEEAFEAWK